MSPSTNDHIFLIAANERCQPSSRATRAENPKSDNQRFGQSPFANQITRKGRGRAGKGRENEVEVRARGNGALQEAAEPSSARQRTSSPPQRTCRRLVEQKMEDSRASIRPRDLPRFGHDVHDVPFVLTHDGRGSRPQSHKAFRP